MTKRTVVKFWVCVIGIQITGLAMVVLGGDLDDPVKLLGLFVLSPGTIVMWGRAIYITTLTGVYFMLATAMAINLAVAGVIHFLFWVQYGKAK
jgi:hypothetical protein